MPFLKSAPVGKVEARTSFWAYLKDSKKAINVQEGQRFSASDEVVRQFPEKFTTPQIEVAVEAATAAPGEKR